MKENEKTKETKEKKGAKEYSLLAQIIASIWIAGWNSFQFVRAILAGGKVDVKDIIISGLAVAGCFAPVYVSIIVDKVKEIRAVKYVDDSKENEYDCREIHN